MSNFDFAAPYRTSTPDWMFDGVPCKCLLPMCPECDPDFYVDQMREWEHIWADEETPF